MAIALAVQVRLDVEYYTTGSGFGYLNDAYTMYDWSTVVLEASHLVGMFTSPFKHATGDIPSLL